MQFIVKMTFQTFPLLNVIKVPAIKTSHVPHRFSAHFAIQCSLSFELKLCFSEVSFQVLGLTFTNDQFSFVAVLVFFAPNFVEI